MCTCSISTYITYFMFRHMQVYHAGLLEVEHGWLHSTTLSFHCLVQTTDSVEFHHAYEVLTLLLWTVTECADLPKYLMELDIRYHWFILQTKPLCCTITSSCEVVAGLPDITDFRWMHSQVLSLLCQKCPYVNKLLPQQSLCYERQCSEISTLPLLSLDQHQHRIRGSVLQIRRAFIVSRSPSPDHTTPTTFLSGVLIQHRYNSLHELVYHRSQAVDDHFNAT